MAALKSTIIPLVWLALLAVVSAENRKSQHDRIRCDPHKEACHDCNSRLVCRPNGEYVQRCQSPWARHCSRGRCVSEPSKHCRPKPPPTEGTTEEIPSTTEEAASTTVADSSATEGASPTGAASSTAEVASSTTVAASSTAEATLSNTVAASSTAEATLSTTEAASSATEESS